MAKLRSLSTAFWSDPFIEDLTPQQKLLFVYLVTNDKTNMLGIYESTIRKMSFETSINKSDIEKALKEFQDKGKVKYIDNYVVLVNYMKHQNYNTNMKKSAIDVYNNLPNSLKDNSLSIDKSNPLKGFERLLNHYGMVRKVEVEYEVEVKDEIEETNDNKTLTFTQRKDKFLDWFNNQKKIHTNKQGQFKILTPTDENNLKKLFQVYDHTHFQTAINSLFKSKWAIDNNMLTPSHFIRLENFNKYLDTAPQENLKVSHSTPVN